jgi:hypothetical protein
MIGDFPKLLKLELAISQTRTGPFVDSAVAIKTFKFCNLLSRSWQPEVMHGHTYITSYNRPYEVMTCKSKLTADQNPETRPGNVHRILLRHFQ